MGSKSSSWLGYKDKPLDVLAALIIAALAVQLLSFASNRAKNPTSLIDRWRGTGVINDPQVIGNVVLCSLVVIRLSFFRKKGDPHRTWASWLAYLLVLA